MASRQYSLQDVVSSALDSFCPLHFLYDTMASESDEPQTLPHHDNSSDVSKLHGSCRYADARLLDPLRSPVALCASSDVLLHIGDPPCEDDRHGSRFSFSLVAVVAGHWLLDILGFIMAHHSIYNV